MNLDKHLKCLAARARGEGVPTPPIAHRVIALLSADTPAPVYALERPLMWMAGLSSALAVSIVVVALMFYLNAGVDPLNEVMETVSWASLQ